MALLAQTWIWLLNCVYWRGRGVLKIDPICKESIWRIVLCLNYIKGSWIVEAPTAHRTTHILVFSYMVIWENVPNTLYGAIILGPLCMAGSTSQKLHALIALSVWARDQYTPDMSLTESNILYWLYLTKWFCKSKALMSLVVKFSKRSPHSNRKWTSKDFFAKLTNVYVKIGSGNGNLGFLLIIVIFYDTLKWIILQLN